MRNNVLLRPGESSPENNPNHPLVRCVDSTGPFGEWVSGEDTKGLTAPYRVFDVLNQRHVGPKFWIKAIAELYLVWLGGKYATGAGSRSSLT